MYAACFIVRAASQRVKRSATERYSRDAPRARETPRRNFFFFRTFESLSKLSSFIGDPPIRLSSQLSKKSRNPVRLNLINRSTFA